MCRILTLVLLAGCSAAPQPRTPTTEDIMRATVIVSASDRECAGVYVGQRLVATAAHCAEEGQLRVLTYAAHGDGEPALTCSVTAVDVDADLALLECPKAVGIRVLRLRETPVRPGERVRAIGHPAGIEWTLTDGVVSRHSQQMAGRWFVFASTPIWSGNSGGPLVDQQGRLVGIASGIALGVPHLGRYGSSAELARMLDA